MVQRPKSRFTQFKDGSMALPVNSHKCRAVLEFSARKTGPTSPGRRMNRSTQTDQVIATTRASNAPGMSADIAICL